MFGFGFVCSLELVNLFSGVQSRWHNPSAGPCGHVSVRLGWWLHGGPGCLSPLWYKKGEGDSHLLVTSDSLKCSKPGGISL